MRKLTQQESPQSLLNGFGTRKYLNASERKRFRAAAAKQPTLERLFCLTLFWSGGRVSEVLALTAVSIDLDARAAIIETLKRRRPGVCRQVPLPPALVRDLNREFRLHRAQRDPELARRRLWSWSRTTAWRRVKTVMKMAGISGLAACPKGLRHSFGVSSFQTNVPPHLVQRWLGHASLSTTGIYGDVIGREEYSFAARMWRN